MKERLEKKRERYIHPTYKKYMLVEMIKSLK